MSPLTVIDTEGKQAHTTQCGGEDEFHLQTFLIHKPKFICLFVFAMQMAFKCLLKSRIFFMSKFKEEI